MGSERCVCVCVEEGRVWLTSVFIGCNVAAYPCYIRDPLSAGDPNGYEVSPYPFHNGVHQDNYEVYQH